MATQAEKDQAIASITEYLDRMEAANEATEAELRRRAESERIRAELGQIECIILLVHVPLHRAILDLLTLS